MSKDNKTNKPPASAADAAMADKPKPDEPKPDEPKPDESAAATKLESVQVLRCISYGGIVLKPGDTTRMTADEIKAWGEDYVRKSGYAGRAIKADDDKGAVKDAG